MQCSNGNETAVMNVSPTSTVRTVSSPSSNSLATTSTSTVKEFSLDAHSDTKKTEEETSPIEYKDADLLCSELIVHSDGILSVAKIGIASESASILNYNVKKYPSIFSKLADIEKFVMKFSLAPMGARDKHGYTTGWKQFMVYDRLICTVSAHTNQIPFIGPVARDTHVN